MGNQNTATGQYPYGPNNPGLVGPGQVGTVYGNTGTVLTTGQPGVLTNSTIINAPVAPVGTVGTVTPVGTVGAYNSVTTPYVAPINRNTVYEQPATTISPSTGLIVDQQTGALRDPRVSVNPLVSSGVGVNRDEVLRTSGVRNSGFYIDDHTGAVRDSSYIPQPVSSGSGVRTGTTFFDRFRVGSGSGVGPTRPGILSSFNATQPQQYINVDKIVAPVGLTMLGQGIPNQYSARAGTLVGRLPGVQATSHATLRQQSNYTFNNLQTVLGRKLKGTYPTGEGQIYNIKQFNATYQGPYQKGVPHGRGVAYFYDGGHYRGDFVYGDAQGEGVYIYPNGSVYEGQFANSRFNGLGTLVYIDRRLKYEGNFVNGLPHGMGRESYDEGDIYEGNFVNGVKSGYGEYTWKNGQKYQGQWQEGLMHGKGALLNGANVVFMGDWNKGMKHGRGVFRTADGTYEGVFENDFLNGPGSFMYNDGKLYRGNFFRTMMHGDGTMYYPNGQIADGYWQRNHNKMLQRINNDPSTTDRIMNQIRGIHQKGQQLPAGGFGRQLSMNIQSYGAPGVVTTGSGIIQPSGITPAGSIRQIDSYDGSIRQPSTFVANNNVYGSNINQGSVIRNNNITADVIRPQNSLNNSGIMASNVTPYDQPRMVAY